MLGERIWGEGTRLVPTGYPGTNTRRRLEEGEGHWRIKLEPAMLTVLLLCVSVHQRKPRGPFVSLRNNGKGFVEPLEGTGCVRSSSFVIK